MDRLLKIKNGEKAMARKICIVLLCVTLALVACGQVSPCRDEPTPDIDQYAGSPTQEDETQEAASYISALPVDAPDLHTPTPADITNPRAEQLIVPIGSDVFNNGGQVVQVGDSFYFFAPNDNPEDSRPRHAIYVRREGGAERYRLAETHSSTTLHYIGGQILASTSQDGEMRTIRINTQTGEVDDNFATGNIVYVDHKAGEIFYRRIHWSAGRPVSTGLYKADFDGNVEQFLAEGRYAFLGIVGDTIFLEDTQREEESSFDIVLYTMNRDGSEFDRLIAIKEPEGARHEYEPDINTWIHENVLQFETYGDWLFLIVGRFEGSAGFFYGGIVRMRTDGSELEWLRRDSRDFFILEGWLYFNVTDYSLSSFDSGAHRIPTDFSAESEFLDEEFTLLTGGGRIIYASGPRNIDWRALRSRSHYGGDSVVLFAGRDVPRFEHSDWVRFTNIHYHEGYVFFTVNVSGHATYDSWRGHDCYMAHYRVRYDGTGLTLINEENLCWISKFIGHY